MIMSIYKLNGYDSRGAYLDDLADNYGLNRNVVYGYADILGANEDFDGLITALEDHIEMEEMS